ncbi:hypothetical protein [Synechococcus sp. CS-602]|uniref:hypothetical protein n=1 Tax=Synechococcus sp. CS-602 TaxID=2847982 RepID=UPI00223A704D|nr:hypothetical protein [Synechococcus sp. CS-602]
MAFWFPQSAVLLEGILLTLLSVDSGEQQHFILPRYGLPNGFCGWLVRLSCEIESESHGHAVCPASDQAIRQAVELVLRQGGQPLDESDTLFSVEKYLITFNTRRGRIFVSAWSREDVRSRWQRQWIPRALNNVESWSVGD